MRSITRIALVTAVAGALVLAGCGDDSDSESSDTTEATEETTTTEAAADIEITDAWARQSPMGTTAGAVYMNITAAEDDALVGASVPEDIAGTTEVHETVMAEETMEEDATETTMAGGEDDMGTMTMQEVESVELPAGETVALEPGGFHIMLLDLVAPLEVGDEVTVTLSFESGATQTVVAEVREA
jgi:copper(I)-binding protein